MRKYTPVLMSGLLIMSMLLTSCGIRHIEDQEKPGEEQKVLNVWHQWGGDTKSGELIQEAVSHYEKAHPDIKINIHSLSTKTYTTKITMDFVGTAEDVDVFYYQVPSMMNRLVDADKLLPLNEFLTGEVLSKIKPGRLQDMTVDKNIYGLPLYSSVFVLYCNQKLFREAGVELPDTSEEFLEAGRELLKHGITPLAVGAQDAWLAGGLYESAAVTMVGADAMKEVLNGDKTMAENSEFGAAAEQLHAFFEEGMFGEQPLNMTEFDAMDAFLDGHAAMFLDGTWASEYIDVSGMDPGDIAVIAYPPSADSRYVGNYVGSMTSGSFLVNKNTELPGEAADFTIYLTEYLGTRVYESGSGLACWDADQTNISPTLKKVAALWDGVENFVPAWDTVLSIESAQLHLNECQGLLQHDVDVEQFLREHDELLGK